MFDEPQTSGGAQANLDDWERRHAAGGSPPSAQMLDLIFDNLYLDNNAIYDFGGSTTALSSAMFYHTDFASAYAGIEAKIQADIDKVEQVY